MSPVKFSVVIPTRERAQSLAYTLRTCLEQAFDEYEVIVSDNAGSPGTRAIVDSLASPRIRYHRTSTLLSMSANWEFALTRARGEYLVLIGDDDALLPHALAGLDQITSDTRPKAIRWEPVFYTWPDYPLVGQGNYLRVPLLRGLREADGMLAAREVVEFRALPESLPSVYHGAVRRDVFDEIARTAGRVVGHRQPAVYLGFAVAAVAKQFLSVDAPMTICGRSSASQTVPRPYRRVRSAAAEELRQLNDREGLMPDPCVPDLPVNRHAVVADAFRAAKRQLFPGSSLEVNRRQLAAGCVSNLRAETEADWRAGLDAIGVSLADDTETRLWFENGLAKSPFRKAAPARVRAARLGFDETDLHLDAAEFGVADVAAAAVLCERILNFRVGVRHDTRARSLAVEVADLRRTCSNQQGVIDSLQQTCEERLVALRRLERQRGLYYRLGTWVKQQLGSRSRI